MDYVFIVLAILGTFFIISLFLLVLVKLSLRRTIDAVQQEYISIVENIVLCETLDELIYVRKMIDEFKFKKSHKSFDGVDMVDSLEEIYETVEQKIHEDYAR